MPRSLDADYPILSDPDRRAAKAYGVARDDKSPAIRWTFYIGSDGKVLDIDRQVTPSTHGRDVAAKLAELGVKRRAAKGHGSSLMARGYNRPL